MKRVRQIVCILMASALLVLSPVSAFFDSANMASVQAADIAVSVGGSYLFEFLLALFGVSMTGFSDIRKENAYQQYLYFLEQGEDSVTAEILSGYRVGDSVEVTGALVGSVSDYLQSISADIISGTVGTVTIPDDTYMGSSYANSSADIAFRNYISSNQEIPQYYGYSTIITTSSNDECYYLMSPLSSYYQYLVHSSSDSYYYLLTFDESGSYDTIYGSLRAYKYIYNSLSGAFTYESTLGKSIKESNIDQFYLNIPVLDATSLTIDQCKNLSVLLSNSTCLNGELTAPKYIVTGNYNTKNVEAITGQTVSGDTITAVNSAVTDVIGANTTTDESGEAVYADAIGQAVADAVSKALEDSGFKVIEGGGGSETDPGEEEEPDPLPYVPQIIEKIDEVGGAIKSGFNNVIDNITTTGEEIKNGIVEQIQSVLEALFVPDLAPVQDSLDMIQGKFVWIKDIYDMFDTIFTSMHPDPSPPVIYIDFTKSESNKYVPVGKRVALDFSWYAPYKATGDLIIGSFLWVLFLWHIFKRLPEIINGGGMVEREDDN